MNKEGQSQLANSGESLMAMVINSNIQSLNAQRHLSNSLSEQNMATERLSSGKRINSAADDAAGLAIANRMTSQVEGLNMAIRNANDGVSLIKTAEGALDESTNILQRMRELSIQSANGIYDDDNRATLNAEVQQLKSELDRISETTSFNGLSILDGSLGEVNLQVGENANQTIALEIGKMDTKNLGAGSGADVVGAELSAADVMSQMAASNLSINGQQITGMSTTDTQTSSGGFANALDNINKQLSGIEVSAFVELKADKAVATLGDLNLTVVGQDGSSTTVQIRNADGDAAGLVKEINEKGGDALKAKLDDEGKIVLSSESAVSITVAGSGAAGAGFTTTTSATARLEFNITDSNIKSVDIDVSDAASALGVNDRTANDITGATSATFGHQLVEGDLKINGVEIGAATSTSFNQVAKAINEQADKTGVTASATSAGLQLNSVKGGAIELELGESSTLTEATLFTNLGMKVSNNAETTGDSVSSIDISTAAGAQKAIKVVDEALKEINETRGDLGAITNRLDSTVKNLSNVSENAAAARSRIQDADFAAESANLSRAQVLQQAGNAMLAQANSRPQQVLSLLQ